MKSQMQIYREAEARIARLNDAMLDLLFGPEPISDDELVALVQRRPEQYARFAGYIGTRGPQPPHSQHATE